MASFDCHRSRRHGQTLFQTFAFSLDLTSFAPWNGSIDFVEAETKHGLVCLRHHRFKHSWPSANRLIASLDLTGPSMAGGWPRGPPGVGTKVGSTFIAFGSRWRLMAGLGLPFRQVASWVRQFRSMCKAQVLSWRSSFNCSFFSCNSCRIFFSFWWCCLRSSWHLSRIIWCCCRVLLTGSWVFSLEARCWRQDAHVEVNSIGSSNDRICVLVSWMVFLVTLIWFACFT